MIERVSHPARALVVAAALLGAALAGPQHVRAAEPPPAKEPGAPERFDPEAIKEQMRRLGEMIRDAIRSATEGTYPADPGVRDGGIGGLAPSVSENNLRAVYGPDGPTVKSVSVLLAYRLVLLGNPRLKAGRVHEQDGWIVAEVVTVQEQALVARYMINKTTGVWVPQR